MASHAEPNPAPARPFESVRALLDKYRAEHPDKTAIHDLDQDSSMTFSELHDMANRLARFLSARGIGRGGNVAVLADENLEKLVCWMGIWRLGAVVCVPNVELNRNHLSLILGNMRPDLVLVHADMHDPALTEGLACESIVFSAWQGGGGADDLFALLADYADGPEVADENGPQDVSAMFCTSGTTALPKTVIYDHWAYWLNGLSTLDMLGLTGDDKTLEYRSFGWNSAQILSLMPWLQTGLTMHIAKRFSHSRFFDWIRDHGITFAAGVPTVVNMLLNDPHGVTADDVPTLRLMTCSTAPLSPEQWQKFERQYGVTLLQLYGMSEAGWICGNRHYRRKIGTVGPPAKHQEFRIVDDDGNPCPTGVEGEITIGGPQTCIAVITPEGEYEDLSDARIPTGDLGTMDEDGFVRVTGRTKDLIIRGGVNIAPVEIENVLLRNSEVLEAAAVGVPDPIYGEEIVCFVVPKQAGRITEAALEQHCGVHLPAFKAPKAFRFVDELPKSDRGKVRREALKEQWMRESETTASA